MSYPRGPDEDIEYVRKERDFARDQVAALREEIKSRSKQWRVSSIARELARERDEARAINAELLVALDTLASVVGLTAFKHESQRAVLQEAMDIAMEAIKNAKKGAS